MSGLAVECWMVLFALTGTRSQGFKDMFDTFEKAAGQPDLKKALVKTASPSRSVMSAASKFEKQSTDTNVVAATGEYYASVRHV